MFRVVCMAAVVMEVVLVSLILFFWLVLDA